MYVSIVVHVSVEEDLVSSSIIQPFPLQQLATIFFTFIYSFVHVCICGGACVPQLAGVGAFYYVGSGDLTQVIISGLVASIVTC